jgi:hypothetical protein
MSLVNILVVAYLFLATSALAAQAQGPTVAEARVAFFASPTPGDATTITLLPPAECGSTVKNAALLGLGFFFAAAVLELTYTFLREPFVLNGVDLPAADPRIIAGAAGGGFLVGLVGTELCRRRRR